MALLTVVGFLCKKLILILIKYFRLFKMSGDMWYPALLAMAEQFRLYFYMDSWGKLIKIIFFSSLF